MLSIICCEVVTPVALFTRAWIEIFWKKRPSYRFWVALFTRAWIEIHMLKDSVCVKVGSPSSRGRGLKYTGDKVGGLNSLVALFTRAWIEIDYKARNPEYPTQSPSSRGRGLKFLQKIKLCPSPRSPSSRGRGLKSLFARYYFITNIVALFTRAWIEIRRSDRHKGNLW